MAAPVIEFRATRFAVGERTLVGPLDLAVERGETMVLLGESGSGKTTTLRLINRLLEPTEGEVVIEGRESGTWDRVQLRRRIGYVIQEVGLFPHLSVERNVGIVPRLEKWATERIEARVEQLLTMVGLPPTEFRDRLPHRLSGGQRQRVGVARALAADPPILLCDEPFGAVDPVTRSTLQREFSGLVRRLEKTVVFVTHDVREATALADRLAVFDRGRACFIGSVDAFLSDPAPAVRALRASG